MAKETLSPKVSRHSSGQGGCQLKPCLHLNFFFAYFKRPSSIVQVCYRLLPENEEFELMSLHSVELIPYHIGGCDDPVGGDSSLVCNLEAVGSDIRTGCQETGQRDMECEKEKQFTKVEKDYASDIKSLKQFVLEQHARISALERKVVNLEALVASKGKREIEGMNDMIIGEVCEQVGYGLTGTTPLHESCVEGDEGHTVEVITRRKKQGCWQNGKRKMLKSTIAKGNLMLKKRRDITTKKASIPSMEVSTFFFFF